MLQKKLNILLILVLSIITFSLAQNITISNNRIAPKLLNYQGYLTDSLGIPFDGNFDITFAIYDAIIGGNIWWTENQNAVSVKRGVFSVLLGSISTIEDSVFVQSNERWLEIAVNAQSLTPRTRITSVPYANSATYADTANYARFVGGSVLWNTYLVENNNQVVKNDTAWTDFLTTTITVDQDSSDIIFMINLSGTKETGNVEIAFRAKVGSVFTNPSLVEYVALNRIQQLSFDFLIPNMPAGTYTAGIEWKAISGAFYTSFYRQGYAYNRMIIVVQ